VSLDLSLPVLLGVKQAAPSTVSPFTLGIRELWRLSVPVVRGGVVAAELKWVL
jgi:hypothetical protein